VQHIQAVHDEVDGEFPARILPAETDPAPNSACTSPKRSGMQINPRRKQVRPE